MTAVAADWGCEALLMRPRGRLVHEGLPGVGLGTQAGPTGCWIPDEVVAQMVQADRAGLRFQHAR